MQKTNTIINTRTIYSFRIKNLLELKGFKPILETNNPVKEGYKCWIFESTPAFEEAFIEIAGRRDYNG